MNIFTFLKQSLVPSRLEILKADSSLKSKAKRNEWTWKAQTDVVKWQATPLRAPLLRLPAALAPPALECFTCVRAYCGDLQPSERTVHQDLTEVKCVYTVLMVSTLLRSKIKLRFFLSSIRPHLTTYPPVGNWNYELVLRSLLRYSLTNVSLSHIIF